MGYYPIFGTKSDNPLGFYSKRHKITDASSRIVKHLFASFEDRLPTSVTGPVGKIDFCQNALIDMLL